MKFSLFSVYVDDQDKALKFYTNVLGFVKKADIPFGEARFLTVVSPAGPDDIQLLLEPNDNPIARTYQEGLFKEGLPVTIFAVEDIQKEYERMAALGVVFRSPPEQIPDGPIIATFEDTCGNLIQLAQA